MITWKLVGAIFKRVAPVLVVALVIGFTYHCGATRGDEKLRKDLAEAKAHVTVLEDESDQYKAERDQARTDLVTANDLKTQAAADYRTRERELRYAADQERIRLASSYGRLLEEARAESADLRARVANLEPGEACLVVMREMADATR